MITSCLDSTFYTEQDSLSIATGLLGKYFHFQNGRNSFVIQIVETEAYLGEQDKASHAAKGKTKRNAMMYKTGACLYIYFVYGMYFMLNIVTQHNEVPEAILIRAAKPIRGIETMKKNRNNMTTIINLCNGPGKLTQALDINTQYNGHSVCSPAIYIEDAPSIPSSDIVQTARIGVDYARDWSDKPLRFFIKNNPYVSPKKR